MSVLHMPCDDSPFIRQREQSSYETGLALEINPASLLHGPYLFDQSIHPLGSSSSFHSMLYDTHHSIEASHYHLGPLPCDSHDHNAGDVHHHTPLRSVHADLGRSETTPRAYYLESSSAQYYPSTSISQPSMFVSSPCSRSSTPSDTMTTIDRSAPPSPWTMSGSLDPSTGVYMGASEQGPHVRTAQACKKCRGRKAKCSGEHPTCERCRIRGLKCEYAPERKTRGPNKVKRNTADKSSKRISWASRTPDVSTIPTTSNASSPSSVSTSSLTPVTPPGPPYVEFRQSTLNLGKPDTSSRPITATSSHSSPSGGSPTVTNVQVDGRVHSRPSHIDFSGAKLSDQMPISYANDDDTFAYEISDARRQTLPAQSVYPLSYHAHIRSPSLEQLYTPSRGRDVIDAIDPHKTQAFHGPHSNLGYNYHPFDVTLIREGVPGDSELDVSMSAPIAPPTILQEQLVYSMDFQTGFMGLISMDSMDIDAHGVYSRENVSADVDATPSVASDGHGKSLARFETQYAQS